MNRKIILVVVSLFAAGLWAQVPDIEMVLVDGGSFIMGSETGDADEKPLHCVTVDSFYISKFEVTQKEWHAVTGSNPSFFVGENHPVEKVNWYDAVEFCNAYSLMKNLTPCYKIDRDAKDKMNLSSKDKYRWKVECNWNADGYRLPTEAEWEYAARAGGRSDTAFSGSNNINEVAWYFGNSGDENSHDYGTHDVGTKKPNALGIYDMTGNVWEWCWDWYAAYDDKFLNNPRGISYGSERVRRGGSWHVKIRRSTMTTRNSRSPGHRSTHYGIRLVRRCD